MFVSVPSGVGMFLFNFVSTVWAVVWLVLYFLPLFGWIAWHRQRRAQRAHQPTPTTARKGHS
ncbi:hypothetical protein GCM10026982_45680 [Nocardiopsis aegyptia]